MDRFLYRGVNSDIHRENNGKLIPKAIGKPFTSHPYFGDAEFDDGSVWGESSQNTVIQHQKDSSKHLTSGISATPIFKNACQYATHNGKYTIGYVYKIDCVLLGRYQVSVYPVVEHATRPAIAEDKEVILVAHDFGVIPSEIVVEVVQFLSTSVTSGEVKQLIFANAEEITKLHSKVHETFECRNEKCWEWEVACREFHARYDSLAFPGGYGNALKQLELGNSEVIEVALCFLECRPYFFRSGYMFTMLLRRLKQVTLTDTQDQRLREVIVKRELWRQSKGNKNNLDQE